MDDIIAGSYVFTGERSAKSYHINKMAKTLGSAATRAAFQADDEWKKVKAASETNGVLAPKVDRVFMNPTDFSRLK